MVNPEYKPRHYKIPESQTIWETVWDKNGNLQYIVTSNRERTKYYKYVIDEKNNPKRISTANTPKEL